ncbi:MAG: hypothetical protein E7190_10440 [Erysipelotrichaceae bacterium]|nr:hypothetical protein [Erysipelotrichaceae bacterium]
MKIQTAIDRIKAYHRGISRDGNPIDPAKTRDKVLYGDTGKELTGIVTCIWASTEVIREARKLGCNLIMPHEALFWNHGDHQDWLQDNRTYQAKAKLLNEAGITVWRNHDHMHTGIPYNGGYVDGIFYGVMKELGWEDRLTGDISNPKDFRFEGIKAQDLAEQLAKKMGLNGTRIIGDPDTRVRKLRIVGHVDGRNDNNVLKAFEEDDVDCAITMELTDYTFAEYIRDSAMLGIPKAIIPIGHFNIEEPGMRYAATWVNEAIQDDTVPVHFVQAGDMYRFINLR